MTQLEINGRCVDVAHDDTTPLIDVLRDDLGLRGSKVLCRQGTCGLCTVIVDGEPRCACLTPVGALVGSSVETVEGISPREELNVLQEEMLLGGLQCGICTPGMLMSITALLRRNSDPTSEDVRGAIAGNLCRCTGYQQIVEATMRAAGRLG